MSTPEGTTEGTNGAASPNGAGDDTIQVKPEDARDIARVWTRHREIEGNLGALTASYEAQKAACLAEIVENQKRFALIVEQMQSRYALPKDTRWTYDLAAHCFRRQRAAVATPPVAPTTGAPGVVTLP